MNREQKVAAIEEVAGRIQEAQAVLAVDPTGISVKQAADLRARLAEADTTFRVVKNTLTERAADQAGAEPLKGLLEGPTAFAFVHGDAAVAARALAGFRRDNRRLVFKGGTMDGEAISAEEIESIARLPAREVLYGQFVGVLASPVTGLVRGLASLLSGLGVALRQIEERGLVGNGTAPAGAAGEETAPEGPAEESAGKEPSEAAPSEEGPGEEPPSEAPGDPVAEAQAAEEEASEAQQSEKSPEGGA